jgi:hypothetical protein
MTYPSSKQDRLVVMALLLVFSAAAHLVSISVLAGKHPAQQHVVRIEHKSNDATLRNVRLARQDWNTAMPVLRSNSDRPSLKALTLYWPEASLLDSSSSFGFPLLC